VQNNKTKSTLCRQWCMKLKRLSIAHFKKAHASQKLIRIPPGALISMQPANQICTKQHKPFTSCLCNRANKHTPVIMYTYMQPTVNSNSRKVIARAPLLHRNNKFISVQIIPSPRLIAIAGIRLHIYICTRLLINSNRAGWVVPMQFQLLLRQLHFGD
jgi:hypothetical protein